MYLNEGSKIEFEMESLRPKLWVLEVYGSTLTS